jgi:hypothetical protein
MVLHPEHQSRRFLIWGRDEVDPLTWAFAGTVSLCEEIDYSGNSESELFGGISEKFLNKENYATNARAIRTSESFPQPAVQPRRGRGRS